MATNEAVENAIEHGHRLSPEPFHVELAVERSEVVITVRDRGRWQDSERARGNDAAGDRGRGLTLMRAFMDDVEVSPSPRGTTVVLRRALRAGAVASLPQA